jgi:hypothetical protein
MNPIEPNDQHDKEPLSLPGRTADTGIRYTEGPTPSQLVVLCNVYYQSGFDEDPVGDVSRFFQSIPSTEEAYKRRLKINPEQWQILDLGWLKSTSVIFLIHRPEEKDVRPTPAEQEKLKQTIVQIAFRSTEPSTEPFVPVLQLLPDEGIPLRVVPGQSVFLYCEQQTRCYVIAIPR